MQMRRKERNLSSFNTHSLNYSVSREWSQGHVLSRMRFERMFFLRSHSHFSRRDVEKISLSNKKSFTFLSLVVFDTFTVDAARVLDKNKKFTCSPSEFFWVLSLSLIVCDL